MIASVDGAAYVDGHSAGLGGPADRTLFGILRSLADVIVVGATTVREEHYRPARLSPELTDRRIGLGLGSYPPIAVLTRTCHLDWGTPLFTEAEQRTVVITTETASAADRADAARVADVVLAGDAEVSMQAAVVALAERGFENALAEGGPRVLGQFVAAGLLDELCLTIAPYLVPGPEGRIVTAASSAPLVSLGLSHVLEADGGYLFLKYSRRTNLDTRPS